MVNLNSSISSDRCKEENFGESLLRDIKKQRLSYELNKEEFKTEISQLAKIAGLAAAYNSALFQYGKGRAAEALSVWERVYKQLALLMPDESKPERARCLSSMCLAALKLRQFEKAKDYGNSAIQLAQETPCREIEAGALGNLANVCRLTKEFSVAMECRYKAIAIFQDLNDPRGEAMELSGLGNLEFELGNLEKAIELHQKALSLIRQFQHFDLMPHIMQNLEHTQAVMIKRLKRQPKPSPYPQGYSQEIHIVEQWLAQAEDSYRRQNWRDVQRYASQAFEICESINLQIGMMATSHLLAGAFVEQKDWQRALEPAQTVVTICRELQLIGGLENGLKNLFTILEELGDVTACIACLEEHLDLTMTYGKAREAAPILKTLGEYMRRVDNYNKARRYQFEALALFKHFDDKRNVAIVLDELGVLAGETGNYDEGLAFSQQALELFKRLGNKDDIAISWANRGGILLRLGDNAAAAEHFSDAIIHFRTLSPSPQLVASLDSLGTLCVEEGMFLEAISFFDEAFQIAQTLGLIPLMEKINYKMTDLQIRSGGLPLVQLEERLNDATLTPHMRCLVSYQLSNIHVSSGNKRLALKPLNEAISIAEELADGLLADLLISRARVYVANENESKAEMDYYNAIGLLESRFFSLTSDEHRLHLWSKLQKNLNPYRELIILLYQQGDRGCDAFEVVEQAKGRVFLELMGETIGISPWNLKMDEIDVFSKLSMTEYRLRKAKAKLKRTTIQNERNQIERTIRSDNVKLKKVLKEMKAISPLFVQLRQGIPAKYDSIQQLLRI